MSKWVRVLEFADKYDTHTDNIYVKKHNRALPSFIFKKDRVGLLIDEEFFVRRIKFRKKIWLKSHDNYYFITKNIPYSCLSRYLHIINPSVSIDSWNTFLAGDLFTVPPSSVTRFKVSDMLYKFYRYSRWIIQMAFRKLKIPVKNRDIDVILDNY